MADMAANAQRSDVKSQFFSGVLRSLSLCMARQETKRSLRKRWSLVGKSSGKRLRNLKFQGQLMEILAYSNSECEMLVRIYYSVRLASFPLLRCGQSMSLLFWCSRLWASVYWSEQHLGKDWLDKPEFAVDNMGPCSPSGIRYLVTNRLATHSYESQNYYAQ